MRNETINMIEALKVLGLTSNEAKIYLYLVQHPESNGYEISKNTGISRSIVYGILEKLRITGFIELIQSKSSSYIVKPIEEVNSTIGHNISNAIGILRDNIPKLQCDPQEDYFINISALDNQINKLLYMVESAEKYVYISAGMKELSWIKKALLELPKEVDVHIFSMSVLDEELYRFHIYSKEMDMSFIQGNDRLKDRWRILIIKDGKEMFLCGGEDQDDRAGIYTKNKMMVKFAQEHFVHDVKINNIEKRYHIEDNTEDYFSNRSE